MKKKDKLIMDRREFIGSLFASYGALGLRSLLLGLPTHFLTHRAMAANDAKYFIFSSRHFACPVNCNTPGTYIPGIDHLSTIASGTLTLDGKDYTAAQAWANMPVDLRNRFAFIHHSSEASAHGESSDILKVRGDLKASSGTGMEMLPSAVAQENYSNLGTIDNKPILISNIGGSLTFNGVSQAIVTPSSLKSTFANSMSANAEKMMKFRDQQLDLLYKDLKDNGYKAQQKYLDDFANSRDKARILSQELSSLLNDVNGNSVNDEIIAAVAIIASKTSPVAAISIPFGGDNHNDSDLSDEKNELDSGVNHIVDLWSRLKALGIQDQTVFALQNVFGRTLKRNTKGGRDHNSLHSNTLIFSPNTQAGVIGGIKAISDRKGGEALAFNSQTGLTSNPDISRLESLASTAKTILKTCGVNDDSINDRVTKGKVIQAALK